MFRGKVVGAALRGRPEETAGAGASVSAASAEGASAAVSVRTSVAVVPMVSVGAAGAWVQLTQSRRDRQREINAVNVFFMKIPPLIRYALDSLYHKRRKISIVFVKNKPIGAMAVQAKGAYPMWIRFRHHARNVSIQPTADRIRMGRETVGMDRTARGKLSKKAGLT